MGRNFDDYPGFQPFRSWENTYAQDCKYITNSIKLVFFLLFVFVSITFQGLIEARSKKQKYFRWVFGSNENFKIWFFLVSHYHENQLKFTC